jgi:adenylate cyclase
MIERERKFLLKDFTFLGDEILDIKQGYMMIQGSNQLRVRITKSKDREYAQICYKYKISSTDKNEFEYEIPLSDAYELWESCEYKLEKQRYVVDEKTTIDYYPNHFHLYIVEIEYNTEELENIPKFCGKDVTNDYIYSNFKLAGYDRLEK